MKANCILLCWLLCSLAGYSQQFEIGLQPMLGTNLTTASYCASCVFLSTPRNRQYVYATNASMVADFGINLDYQTKAKKKSTFYTANKIGYNFRTTKINAKYDAEQIQTKSEIHSLYFQNLVGAVIQQKYSIVAGFRHQFVVSQSPYSLQNGQFYSSQIKVYQPFFVTEFGYRITMRNITFTPAFSYAISLIPNKVSAKLYNKSFNYSILENQFSLGCKIIFIPKKAKIQRK